MTTKTINANATEKELFKMLTENTGRALCDSGGAYGRNWERNQKLTLKALKESPEVVIDIPDEACEVKDLTYTISVFHYLERQLSIDEICESFNRRNMRAKDWDSDSFYGVGEKVEKWLMENHEVEVHRTTNSYNGEDHLSQVIQYTNITINGECYVVLQIHGGCDVRGGYTNARLFKLENEMTWEGGFLNSQDVHAALTKMDGTFYRFSNVYDGYSLQLDGVEMASSQDSEQLSLDVERSKEFSQQELHAMKVVFDPEFDKIEGFHF